MWIAYVQGSEVALKDAEEIGSNLRELSQGKKKLLLIDARLLKNINRDARIYWASKEVTQTIKAAAILSSPVASMLGALYSRLSKPPFIIKYFSWLLNG